MEFLINCLGWFIIYYIVDFGREEDNRLITFSSKGVITLAFIIAAVKLINLKL